MSTILENALRLPAAERVELIQQLWDSLPDHDADPLLSDTQIAELRRREERLEREGPTGEAWEVVKARILARRAK